MLTILLEIQKIIDKYLNIILKEKWDLRCIDLVKYEIYLKHDYLIKRSVRYMNPRLAD